MTDLEWDDKKVCIKDLREYKHNPRRMTSKEYEKLIRSLKEDGYHSRIKVDKNLTIIGGHSRKKALMEVFGPNAMITVLYPNRELTEEEFDRINIRDNLPYGSYDFDILSSRFDLETLSGFGMEESMIVGFDFGGEDVGKSISEDKEEKSKCTCTCCKH